MAAHVYIDGQFAQYVRTVDELRAITEGMTFTEREPLDARCSWAYTHGKLPDGRTISIGTNKHDRDLDAFNTDLGLRLHLAWKQVEVKP